MPGIFEGGTGGVVQGKLVDSVDGAQRYQFGGPSAVPATAGGGGGSATPLVAESLSPHMNKHDSRMSLETGGGGGASQVASKSSGGRHGASSPPTPPLKTSSLERNYSNRIVQFKQARPDLHDTNAAYVDV